MFNNDLVNNEFVHRYLDSKLKGILGRDYLSYRLEIHQRYGTSGNWIIEVKTEEKNLKLVGLFKEDKENLSKSFELAKFFNGKSRSFFAYKPLHYDSELGIFFYYFVEGKTYRDLVEQKQIDFNTAVTKVEQISSLLKELALFELPKGLENIDCLYNIERFFRHFEKYTNSIFEEVSGPLGRLKEAFENTNLENKTLCHGDFQAGNIIFDGGPPAVIDWESAFGGDSSYDAGTFLAHTDLMFDYHYGAENSSHFIENFIKQFEKGNKVRLFGAYTYFKVADFLAAAYGKDPEGKIYKRTIPDYSKDDKNFDLIRKIVRKADSMLNSL